MPAKSVASNAAPLRRWVARNGADSLGGMAEHDFSDHRQAAQMHLEAAEQGFEHMEDKGDAAMLYAQTGDRARADAHLGRS